jgi:dTDP-L-rhamnose 4-epimerase
VRILVTGGAGFIGSHVVRRLVERGDEVVVLDSLEPQVHAGSAPTLPDGVAFFRGSVGDSDILGEVLEGIEAVVHLAAVVGVGQSMYEMGRYAERNTLATARFLDALVAQTSLPRRLVVASSMSIYGEGEYECETHGVVTPPPRNEQQLLARSWECECPLCGEALVPRSTRESKPVAPTSIYAITKRDHEELCLVAGAAYGIPAVALRFFNVYGPGQALSNPYTGVGAIFSSRLLNNRSPLVFEDGLQSRDFVHVSDIVDAILRALESESAVGRAINVGTGRPVTISEIATMLAEHLGKPIAPEYPGTYRAGDIRHCYADTQLAEESLGFRASVKFEHGISDLVDWVSNQTATDSVDTAASELVVRGLAR